LRNGANTVVTIELYGVPRLRAGTALVLVEAVTLADALDQLARACPSLAGAVVANGRILPAYRLSLNGERFISDPETPLASGDVLLLLSADVGG
jgi:molybdopterin converting factor small subunit